MPNIVFEDDDYVINQKPDNTYDVFEKWDDGIIPRGHFVDLEKAFEWIGKKGSLGGQAYHGFLTGGD